MATKKSTAKKKAVKKPKADKKSKASLDAKKAPSKKKAAVSKKKKSASKAKRTPKLTPEQLFVETQELAYLLAEKDAFQRNPTHYWLDAEAEVKNRK